MKLPRFRLRKRWLLEREFSERHWETIAEFLSGRQARRALAEELRAQGRLLADSIFGEREWPVGLKSMTVELENGLTASIVKLENPESRGNYRCEIKRPGFQGHARISHAWDDVTAFRDTMNALEALSEREEKK